MPSALRVREVSPLGATTFFCTCSGRQRFEAQ
jgi:hypothetical protein